VWDRIRIFVAMLLLCSIVMPYSVFAGPPQSLGTSPDHFTDESWSVQEQLNSETSTFFQDYKESGRRYKDKFRAKIVVGLFMAPVVATGAYCAVTYTSLLWIGTLFKGLNGINNEFSGKKYFYFTQLLNRAKKIVYASLSEEEQDQIDLEFKYPFEKIVIQDDSLDASTKADRMQSRRQKVEEFLGIFLSEMQTEYPKEMGSLPLVDFKQAIYFLAANGNFSEILDEVEEQKTLLPFKQAILSELSSPSQETALEDQNFIEQSYKKYAHRAEHFRIQKRNKAVLVGILVPSLGGGIAAAVATAGILSFVPVIEAVAAVRTTMQAIKKNRISKTIKTVLKLMIASLEPQERETLVLSIADSAKRNRFIEKSDQKLIDFFDELQRESYGKTLNMVVMRTAIVRLAKNGRLLKIRKALEISEKLDLFKGELLREMDAVEEGIAITDKSAVGVPIDRPLVLVQG
jgi:hypothetical protein